MMSEVLLSHVLINQLNFNLQPTQFEPRTRSLKSFFALVSFVRVQQFTFIAFQLARLDPVIA